ncbi:cupredoxin domain-containing protein [Pedococcus sp. KACC 23699]|uniref:Cupredoxin domain-containing protein n=1 Tax=Pedococcus sp. KACC 23699 TaxID=3149228 RepID=A0AAU7JWT1_9MICO
MTRKIALLGLVPVLVVGLSACGSSKTDAGNAPSASSTSSMSSSMPMPSDSSTTTEPAPSSSSSSAASTEAVISIADFMFKVPASVAPGAKITIKNSDSQAHTVTSKTGGFDVKVNPNGTATLTAPSTPGSYPFVCSFHANMTSTLVVK